MIKKYLLKLLIRWYVNYVSEIVKITDTEEEVRLYTFYKKEDTEKLIKSLITAQTLRHYQALSEEERLMAKGAANILMIIRDCHAVADEIYDIGDIEVMTKDWLKWKGKNRTS